MGPGGWLAGLLVLLLAGWGTAGAQATRSTVTAGAGVSSSPDPLVPVPVRPLGMLQPRLDETAWRLGPADLHLGASASLTYDDNITLAADDEMEDWIVRLVPWVQVLVDREAADEGSRLSVEYRPLIWLFLDETDNNEWDHRVYVSGRWSTPKLRLGLSQDYEEDSGAVVEAGRRLDRRLYTTSLLGRYSFSELTALTVTPRLEVEEGRALIDNFDWALDAFVDHEVGPKLRVGLGGGVGLWDREDNANGEENPNEYYQRLLARASYEVSAKLNLGATAGVEFRQFEGDRDDVIKPVAALEGTWEPRDSLLVRLEVHVRDEPSVLFDGLDYELYGFSGQVRQRFAERWFVSLAGGYDLRNYRAARAGQSTDREDDYYFGRLGAGLELRRWQFGAYYLRQQNASTVDQQDFTNNQVALEVSWGF